MRAALRKARIEVTEGVCVFESYGMALCLFDSIDVESNTGLVLWIVQIFNLLLNEYDCDHTEFERIHTSSH